MANAGERQCEHWMCPCKADEMAQLRRQIRKLQVEFAEKEQELEEWQTEFHGRWSRSIGQVKEDWMSSVTELERKMRAIQDMANVALERLCEGAKTIREAHEEAAQC